MHVVIAPTLTSSLHRTQQQITAVALRGNAAFLHACCGSALNAARTTSRRFLHTASCFFFLTWRPRRLFRLFVIFRFRPLLVGAAGASS